MLKVCASFKAISEYPVGRILGINHAWNLFFAPDAHRSAFGRAPDCGNVTGWYPGEVLQALTLLSHAHASPSFTPTLTSQLPTSNIDVSIPNPKVEV